MEEDFTLLSVAYSEETNLWYAVAYVPATGEVAQWGTDKYEALWRLCVYLGELFETPPDSAEN